MQNKVFGSFRAHFGDFFIFLQQHCKKQNYGKETESKQDQGSSGRKREDQQLARRNPITNAEDIDRYLEGLRQQIKKLLVDQDGVMIIK